MSDLPLLFNWVCRDEQRIKDGLPADGLYNADAPCGTTLCGVKEESRRRAEKEHTCKCNYCYSRLVRLSAPFQIRFSGPPGPEGCEFVEIEDTQGRSISRGKWLNAGVSGEWLLFFNDSSRED